jgi:hypothetical protein
MLRVFLSAPLVVLWYPTQALVILNLIERTFNLNCAAEASAPNPEASETIPPTANMESRPPQQAPAQNIRSSRPVPGRILRGTNPVTHRTSPPDPSRPQRDQSVLSDKS